MAGREFRLSFFTSQFYASRVWQAAGVRRRSRPTPPALALRDGTGDGELRASRQFVRAVACRGVAAAFFSPRRPGDVAKAGRYIGNERERAVRCNLPPCCAAARERTQPHPPR